MIVKTTAAALLFAAAASAATLTIPGNANIFGAGHATAPEPGGGGAGVLPVLYNLTPGTGRVLTFSSVTGTASCCNGGSTYSGPDGGTSASGNTDILSYGGLSGIVDANHTMFLTGVFLTNAEPADPAPPRLDFSGAAEHFTSLSPLIAQTFFIGDGLAGTGSGPIQQFYVPDNATRLYLGFADAFNFGNPTSLPGYYGDDIGSLSASFNVSSPLSSSVPEPATIAMLGIGLTALGAYRARR